MNSILNSSVKRRTASDEFYFFIREKMKSEHLRVPILAYCLDPNQMVFFDMNEIKI